MHYIKIYDKNGDTLFVPADFEKMTEDERKAWDFYKDRTLQQIRLVDESFCEEI
jgi:hypothetical protein